MSLEEWAVVAAAAERAIGEAMKVGIMGGEDDKEGNVDK